MSKGAKQLQSMTTAIDDTFRKGDKRRALVDKFRTSGLDINKDKEAELLPQALRDMAATVQRQWGR